MSASAMELDVIGGYKSKDGDSREIIAHIEDLIDKDKTTVIGGDFNICALKNPNNIITKKLKELNFQQVVRQATHIEGGLIDHLYIRKGKGTVMSWVIDMSPKYYSDHDCIGVTLCQ